MAKETLVEKAGFAVGVGLAAASDAAGAIKKAIDSGVTAVTGNLKKTPVENVFKATKKNWTPKTVNKAPAKKKGAKKAVKKMPSKKKAAQKVANKAPAKKKATRSVGNKVAAKKASAKKTSKQSRKKTAK